MKVFANLYALLDETTKTTAKVLALKEYFAHAPAADAAWAVFFLIGRKPRQVVPSSKLRTWAPMRLVSDRLFQESHDAVGDVAETIALFLPPPGSRITLSHWISDCSPYAARPEDNQRAACSGPARTDQRSGLSGTSSSARVRVGVSQQLVTRALGEVGGSISGGCSSVDGRLGAVLPSSPITGSRSADAD